MLPALLTRLRRPIVVLLHLVLFTAAYAAAFALRFDLPLPPNYARVFARSLLLLIPVQVLVFYAFGIFRGWWRHVGMQDLLDLLKAATVSSAGFAAVLVAAGMSGAVPSSVLLLHWSMVILLLGGARFAVRAVREWLGAARRRATPTLLVGAGAAAERLIRQIRHDGRDYRIVGLADDDTAKLGMRLHGVPVLGTVAELPALVERCGARLIVIAVPSATREEMQAIVDRCVAAGVAFKIVPSLPELLDGRARVNQLRDVDVQDLLGRDAVKLDLASVHRDVAGKVVLITGAAGSIGSELARQVAKFSPARLVLVDQAESPLFYTHLELVQVHPQLDIVPIIADVTNPARVEEIFSGVRPGYVFHAAAYKHVPMMEINVIEAVQTNVFGTLRVAESAARHGAARFVLISTDKAVNPSSVMGATKRVAERIVLGWPSLRESATDFRAVRFGNVLGSNGSVIPVFRRQLAQGGPLTVTHPDVTRYFMTIPEAVELVLQAASSLPEAARRISMLEMGQPVRIVELAENLIRLSGLEPDQDVRIVFTGLRPGEKLHEELMSGEEATVPTAIEKIRVVKTDEADVAVVRRGVARLAKAVAAADTAELIAGLCALVPECVPPLRDRPSAVGKQARREVVARGGSPRSSALAEVGRMDIAPGR